MTSDHRTCSVDGCELRVRCRSWCNTHYRRWLVHGDPLRSLKMSDGGVCSVESCDAPVVGRGWCRRHYSRWHKRGTIDRATTDRGSTCSIAVCGKGPVQARGLCAGHYEAWRQTNRMDICSVAGCESLVRTRGWCNKHYSRWTRYGDPSATANDRPLEGAPTSLYRVWDHCGVLLYVGITIDIDRRFAEHRKFSEWWVGVEWIGVESFSTRTEAMAAERTAIRTELPAHNRVHMPAA